MPRQKAYFQTPATVKVKKAVELFTYSFPEYGESIQAVNLDEAKKKLELLIKEGKVKTL